MSNHQEPPDIPSARWLYEFSTGIGVLGIICLVATIGWAGRKSVAVYRHMVGGPDRRAP